MARSDSFAVWTSCAASRRQLVMSLAERRAEPWAWARRRLLAAKRRAIWSDSRIWSSGAVVCKKWLCRRVMIDPVIASAPTHGSAH